MSLVNHQVAWPARPTGMPTAANWQFTEEAGSRAWLSCPTATCWSRCWR